MATDPSHGVAQELLPHIHLLNTYRYATTPQVSLPEIAKWLQAAPKIARDTAPFFWTYLEAPPDGSIFLAWQPLNRLGTEFASDGYIWPGNETYYVQDLGNGLTMEMFMQRSGYRPGTEQMTSHARRRFRLVPPKAPTPNAPQVDPSLWIIHYGAEAPQDRHPISAVPHDPRVHQIMNARMALQRWGQIVRKEFMLSDRVNWPQIPLPGGARQPMYPASNNQRGLPPQMAYPPHPGAGVGPPAKRARHAAGAAAAQQQMMGSVPGLEGVQDDEEDTSRGDAFDAYTPRDVSLLRYRQNHDWMEEITSSAFRMGQITFSDLGLGRKGELASLTEGIFNAQGGEAVTEVPKEPIEGKLPPGLADDFRKRVADALEAANAEMEKMKVKHEQLVAELKKNSVLNEAERGIRLAVEETGPEIWRLEGRQEEEQEMSSRPVPKAKGNVEDLVAKVETTLSRQVEPMPLVRRVQDGGYQEPAPKPVLEPVPQQQATGQGDSTSTPAGVAASLSRQSSLAGAQSFEADMDMLGGTAASMMDQMHTGVSSTPTPVNNFPTPQQPAHLSAAPSAAATPANVASPQPPVQKVAGEDVVMGESDADATGAGQAAAGDDWVVVQKGEVPSASAAASRAASVAAQQGGPAAKAATPASTGADAFGGGDSNDFASLGDLDTAGDALASFGDAPVGDLGDGLDLDMEDSAFGDAFHGVSESRDQGGDTPADGGL